MSTRKTDYGQIPNIELITLARKPLTRAAALKILDLEELASPQDWEVKVKKLISLHSDDLGKRAEILAAHSRLTNDHELVVKELRQDSQKKKAEYQIQLSSLQQKVKGHSGDIKLLETLGTQMNKLNQEYCHSLEKSDVNLTERIRNYNATFSTTLNLTKCIIHKEIEVELRAALETMRLNIETAYQHAALYDIDNLDPVAMFKQEFKHYLDDIIKLRDMEKDLAWKTTTQDEADEMLLSYTRYQDDLQNLHAKLQHLGMHYLDEISKDGADVIQLQKEFNQGFKNLVEEAKKTFAKAPGLWANLHFSLQILFCCTLIIPFIILALEKKEDRNRLFFGPPKGEVNISELWKEWEMDVFPNPAHPTGKRGMHGN